MSERALLSLSLALGVGCSVPPSGLGRDVNEISRLAAEMEAAFQDDKFDAAAGKARKLTELGTAAAVRIMIGDPRRTRIDEALKRAREIRQEVAERQALKRSSDRGATAEAIARAALEEAAAATDDVKGPPPGEDVNALLALGGGAKPRPEVPAGRGGDVDFERSRRVAVGDRAGDVEDDEFAPSRKSKDPKDKGPGKLAIDENTPPVVVQKIQTKGKGVAVYFTFVNKGGGGTFIGSVTGTLKRENGKKVGRLITTFEAEGFRPTWEDIHSSGGKGVSAKSVHLQPMQAKQMVAVCEKPKFGEAVSAHIEVRTTDGRTHRGDGPKKE